MRYADKIVNKMLRRHAYVLSGIEFTACAQVVNRLVHYAGQIESKVGKAYMGRMTTWLAVAMAYGQHQAWESAKLGRVTMPEKLNRAERFLLRDYIRLGYAIGMEQRRTGGISPHQSVWPDGPSETTSRHTPPRLMPAQQPEEPRGLDRKRRLSGCKS